jgi:hypothetical protein
MMDPKPSQGKLAEQIEFAKRNIETWPEWLRRDAPAGDKHDAPPLANFGSSRSSSETLPEK